jgi:hypothetical protein
MARRVVAPVIQSATFPAMLRIEVDPGWLGSAAVDHGALGAAFAGLDGDLAQTATSAVGGAGDPGLGHGIGATTQQFGAGLRSLGAEMHGLAAGLTAAARAYVEVDESVIPPR